MAGTLTSRDHFTIPSTSRWTAASIIVRVPSTPVIPKENILLIEGIYDLFADRQAIEELWQMWRQPEIWRLPYGHVSTQLVLGMMGRVLDWLAPRLEAGWKSDT